ncbi:flagellar protein FlgN [Marinobacterium marinum]|uniref:Flagellar export chaperone FlgN n=1 Tax=Marinobacterium marinum TaxID=2756129 RepID=A0A7W1WVE7_9GAMM|nr:flagellar protein FlgN [Marinobacterium marinum]MBA4500897.1 flagellar export chaperone FlgN [Marinobacterium marinum]
MSAILSDDHRQQLDTLIHQGIERLVQLQALLEAELEALQSRALDPLQHNNRAKQECLLAIDRNIRERNTLLEQAGIRSDRASVTRCIEQQPEPARLGLGESWRSLESELDKVKQLNQRNEQVLLRNKQSADQLLALLQGHAQGNTLYDQKGDKGRYEGQRSLGKA